MIIGEGLVMAVGDVRKFLYQHSVRSFVGNHNRFGGILEAGVSFGSCIVSHVERLGPSPAVVAVGICGWLNDGRVHRGNVFDSSIGLHNRNRTVLGDIGGSYLNVLVDILLGTLI